uniref:Uncharacterized protein n=1 Tax=Arundo donax TaxID=35708 RepID=A0A0A9HJL8_ARUDO
MVFSMLTRLVLLCIVQTLLYCLSYYGYLIISHLHIISVLTLPVFK